LSIFEKVVSGELAMPECARTLGFEPIAYCQNDMEIHVAFVGSKSFVNPAGHIQGGFLCAMLDDVMGASLNWSLTDEFAPTLELKTQFIRAVFPGRIEGKARVISRGMQVCYLEGELYQSDKLVAKATATAIIKAVVK
jgi:uncharacterized protein (TIGR00369 family)